MMQYGDYFIHAFSAPLTISSCAEAIEIDPEVMPLWKTANHFADDSTPPIATTIFESQRQNGQLENKSSENQTRRVQNLKFTFRDVVR